MNTPPRRGRTRAAVATTIAGSLLLGMAAPAAADETTPDSTAPVVSSTGIKDGQLARAVFSFYPTVSDDVGVVRLQALVNGDSTITTCAVTTVTRPFCRALLGGLPDDTDAAITVRAYDAAGNEAESTTQVHVDNVPPTLILAPSPKSLMRSGPVPITLQDVPADAREVIVVSAIPGDLVATLTAAPWTYVWPATGGVGSPCFTIFDRAGNTSQLCTDYVVDDHGPTATVTPGSRALVRGARFTTTVKASDPAGVARSYLAGTDGAGLPASYAGATVKTGKDGTRTFIWVLLDKLGNRTNVTRAVIVDNTAPSLIITKAPKNLTKLTKSVGLAAKAGDRNGVARVQLLVNGKVVATDPKAAYNFTLNPKKFGKRFTIQLRAYDKAGNVKYSSKRTYRR